MRIRKEIVSKILVSTTQRYLSIALKRWIRVVFLLCLIVSGPVHAETKSFEGVFTTDPLHPWHLQADEVDYNAVTGKGQASGHVEIRYQEKTLSADRIIFNSISMEASASGNVRLTTGEDVLTAKSVEINLGGEKGVLYDSEILLGKSRFYIRGKKIEQIEPYVYKVYQAEVTSCEGETPDWRITGEELDVTLEEYAFLKHGRIYAGKVPVFYTPIFIFPVKFERQTGLLLPHFGFSTKKGFQYEQPLFWAINAYSDATFYEQYLSRRGNKVGMEYRYALDSRSEGTFKADFLKDSKVDDGSTGSNEWGYSHDLYNRPNPDRYWIRAKASQDLPAGFSGKLDIDVVSDQDYLIEFRDGYSGYYSTQSEFRDNFNRGLDTYEDPVRLNQLNLNRKGTSYSWNTNLKWYDNVIAREHLEKDFTLQHLPQIQFDTLKQPIGGIPVYYTFNSDYTYFYSKDATRGSRVDLYPKFFFPLLRSPYLTVEPSIGARETAWQINRFEDTASEIGKENYTYRHLWDYSVNVRSEAYRIYPLEEGSMKHVIYPELRYSTIPDKDQEEYPDLNDLIDEINRIEKTNQVTFYLAQFLTVKKPAPPEKPKPKGLPEKTPIPSIYKQILEFTLEQTYDINEARADRTDEYRDRRNKRPFLPLESDLQLIPSDFFSIWASTKWDYYQKALTERNLDLSFRNRREDQLRLFYRFTEDALETFGIRMFVKVAYGFSVFGRHERNLMDNESIESRAGFLYDTPCWSVEIEGADKQDDRSIEFVVHLKGLG